MGKSVQALLAAHRVATLGGQTLIVAPGHAFGVWQDELFYWMGEQGETYSGYGRDPRILDTFRYVITNYANLEEVLRRSWEVVIFDEAHTLKNRKAKSLFVTVKGRLRARDGLFFLTGSPIFKHAGDLWPLLHLIDRKRWPGYWKYVDRYTEAYRDEFGWHVEGVRNAKELRRITADVVLQRLKKDVAPDLPKKIRQRVPLAMTGKQARAYRDLEKDMMLETDRGRLLTAPTELAVTTRLRQLLVTPRLLDIDDDGAALRALEEDAGSNPRPLIVFTPFEEALPWIAVSLQRAGYEVIKGLSGKMSPAKKTEAVAAFQTSRERAKALVATIRMGSSWSGTAAAEVHFLGYDWDPPYNIQAEDRPGRYGQEADTILARYYVHQGTVDEEVLDVLAGKKRIADVIAGLRER